jgi:GGDEF domain-containing protein
MCSKELGEKLRLELKLERTEELLSIYRHDSMTGLLMRRDFELKFEELFDSKINFYLTFVDVNGLHSLNRSKGFDAGDKLIKFVADKFMRASDGIVYRIGGDEFVSLTIDEPKGCEHQEHSTCAWVCSENFDSTEEMMKSVDSKIIKKKEEYYSTKDNNRRGNNDGR